MKTATGQIFGGIAVLATLAMSAQAKTVALWPIELDPDTGSLDGRCVVNPDLAAMERGSDGIVGIAQGVGWNLPPNPEPDGNVMFAPVSRTAVKGWRNTAGWTLRCTGAALQQYLWSTAEFTVEGWVKFDPNPASGWFVILQGGGGSDAGKGGWILSWRGTEGARQFHLCVAGYDTVASFDKVIGSVLSPEMEASLTNAWHHLALTHKGTSWKVYVDGGAPIAEATVPERTGHGTASYEGLWFGGRPNSTANRLNASFDYWRVSDQALEPSAFLCAGDVGTLVPEPVDTTTDTTVAYWKLDRKEDGSLDTWDYVGTANLHGGFMPTQAGGQIATNANSVLVPDRDCAFVGDPPNPTASLGGVGNAGSLLARYHNSEYTMLKVPGLGAELEPATGSFTVEAYLKPRRRESPPDSQFLFTTRGSDNNNNGWCLQFLNSNGDWKFVVMACDGAGYIPYNEPVSGALTDWDDWRHVALVYESGAGENGFGQWRCYINGSLSGSYDCSRAWSGTTQSKTLYIGGRDNNRNNFCGWIDCMRLSKAALAPSQFLCAGSGTAAANVIAYWPLNFTNGSFDGRDLVGNYLLQSVHNAQYSPVAAEGAPTVTNPDRSANFDGNAAAALSGSALFRGPNNERQRCSLSTSDPTVANLLGNGEFTYECWFRRHTAQSSSWESVFLTAGDIVRFGDWFQPYLRFAYNEANGFQIEDYGTYGTTVHTFTGTGGQPLDTWRHLALTRAIVDGDNVYTLYLDGVQAGTALTFRKSYSNRKSIDLLIGGRPSDVNNSWRGQFSSIRISRGVLPATRFLCAAPEVTASAAEPRTIVYWPFDNAAGAADTTPAFGPEGFDLRARSANGVSGVAEMAAPRVLLETAEFPRANSGSVVLAENAYMRALYLGNYLSSDVAFTVEGWLKWDGATRGGEVTVCGQYDSTSASTVGRIGWKLIIDDTGDTPLFGLYARSGYKYTPMAKGLFSARPVRPGAWQHVALAYDPHAGVRGVWKLYVNGRQAGTVANTWYDATNPTINTYFKFGRMNDVSATGFSGGLDMWRISSGVLGPEQLLFQRNMGFLFTVK